MKRALILALQTAALCAAAELPTAKPESVGFSTDRLQNLHSLIQDEINQKQLAGAVTILARHGKVIDYRTYGQSDREKSVRMTNDTIFRAYSMTKPLTGVAMMILYEQGKWLPWHPISEYIPEFVHLKVFNGFDALGNMILVDPEHSPTVAEVMSHSAGFSYGFTQSPVDAMYHEKNVLQSANLHEMIEKLATIPLNYQPGTRWQYSVGMDIEGYMVEKLSSRSLPDFMRDHVFEPLGMKDTGFTVPAEKRVRMATCYEAGAPKAGATAPQVHDGVQDSQWNEPPTFPDAAAGLVSTVDDYLAFGQMMLDGGKHGRERILSRPSVEAMVADQLTPEQKASSGLVPGYWDSLGWGFGVGIVTRRDGVAAVPGRFGWDGGYGTSWGSDPREGMVAVLMTQRLAFPPFSKVHLDFWTSVYQAIDD